MSHKEHLEIQKTILASLEREDLIRIIANMHDIQNWDHGWRLNPKEAEILITIGSATTNHCLETSFELGEIQTKIESANEPPGKPGDFYQPEKALAKVRILVEEKFALGRNSLHGPQHWDAVLDNGVLLSGQTGTNILVVQAFAHLHDCCREDEWIDAEHGHRAAEFAQKIRESHLGFLNEKEFALLVEAIRYHNEGSISEDPTIGACFDADRLELTRVNIVPDPALMSTRLGKMIAEKIRWGLR